MLERENDIVNKPVALSRVCFLSILGFGSCAPKKTTCCQTYG